MHSEETKAEAWRLHTEEGLGKTLIGRALGVPVPTIHYWLKKMRKEPDALPGWDEFCLWRSPVDQEMLDDLWLVWQGEHPTHSPALASEMVGLRRQVSKRMAYSDEGYQSNNREQFETHLRAELTDNPGRYG